MKVKRFLAYCLVVFFTVLCGCSCASNNSASASYIAGDDLTNQSFVHWIGRTEYSSTEEKVYTYYSATGFTVDFFGTELYVTYHATNTDSNKHRPYFVCMLDGQTAQEGTSFCLTEENQIVKVVSGLENKKHTATILKRSEPENSLTAISEIFTDGKFLEPTKRNSLKFQIIGSSGITGHGCLGSAGQDWTTANSSSLDGFGYLVAQKFGAETQFVSASAMGMVWGYRGVAPMTQSYEATGLIASYNANGSTKNVSVHGSWDHSKWVPDVVIANIGGNDWNSHIKDLSGDARTEAETQFKNAVIALLTRIHELYPDARVMWTCTSTSSGNGALAYEAIQTLSFKNKIVSLGIGSMTEGGADNHAGQERHQQVATTVANAITEHFGIAQQ